MTAFEPYVATVDLEVTVVADEGDWLVVNSIHMPGSFRVRPSVVDRVESVSERRDREIRDWYELVERPREMGE